MRKSWHAKFTNKITLAVFKFYRLTSVTYKGVHKERIVLSD